VEGFSEHGKEPVCYIECWKTLEQLSDCQIIKKELVNKGGIMLESTGHIYGWPICEFILKNDGTFYATNYNRRNCVCCSVKRRGMLARTVMD
jgi:hypothetical protein